MTETVHNGSGHRQEECSTPLAALFLGLSAIVGWAFWPPTEYPLVLVTLVGAVALGVIGLVRPSLLSKRQFGLAAGLTFAALGVAIMLSQSAPVGEASSEWILVAVGAAIAARHLYLYDRVEPYLPVERATVVSLFVGLGGALMTGAVVEDILAEGFKTVHLAGLLGGLGLLVLGTVDYLRGAPEAQALAENEEVFYILIAVLLLTLLSVLVDALQGGI